ncbi:MAG: hypothetical protein Unbinned5081contig1000_48 [Prokaryotic dsDNA virus sp.]|nr:MAG: hypothetical protein Unbinned5081contig1000_48 [Prokaryotic dsDNA virus sp.]
MTNRLHPNEFLPFAPKNKGEQVHVNHEGCPAGIDTKRRLYVKRTEDGKVLAYCHHCNGSGISSDTVRARCSGSDADSLLAVVRQRSGAGKPQLQDVRDYRKRADKGAPLSGPKVTPSGKAVFDPDGWPVAARVWLNQYGIDQSKWRWYYEPTIGRLCYTLRDVEGNAVVKCCRGIEDVSPKYRNFKVDSTNPRQFLGTNYETIIVTEDVVSAQRCVDAGYSSFPMLTTVVSDKDILYLTDTFKCVILMLDNDNIDVESKRNKLKSKLELLGCKVVSLVDTTDPKHYNHSELVTLLSETMEEHK